MDWDNLRAEYITTKISMRALAKKYGVSSSSLSKRAAADGWSALRKRFREKVVAKTIEKTSAKEANHLARLIQATTRAIDVAMEAFEDDKQFNRYVVTEGCGEGVSTTTERLFDKVDTKALKDLTSVLKDLTGLAREFYDIPTPAQRQAQELAAERLAMDKRKAESDTPDSSIKVELADGLLEYAE